MNNDDWVLGINGISIPTDEILEKCLPEHLADTTVFVNIRTLIRNAISSFKERGSPMVLTTIVDRIKADIAGLSDVLGAGGSAVNVYSVDYETLSRKGLVNYTAPKTAKQIADNGIYMQAIALCVDLVDTKFPKGQPFNRPPMYTQPTAAIVTHYAHDLVTANKIKLLLVESHTGAAKRRIEWNTKLALSPDQREYIPFSPITYYIYGDKAKNYVGPADKEVRNKIYNIAKKYDWTPATTESRLLFCLQQDDNMLYQFVKNFNHI